MTETTLEGKIVPFTSTDEARAAIEEAFDYRGDVTIETRSGGTVEGFIFDRAFEGDDIGDWSVRLFTKDSSEKQSVAVGDIEKLSFTGKDTAHGKSFERWMEKYKAKKAAEAAEAAAE